MNTNRFDDAEESKQPNLQEEARFLPNTTVSSNEEVKQPSQQEEEGPPQQITQPQPSIMRYGRGGRAQRIAQNPDFHTNGPMSDYPDRRM
jgi:hypothetical protein